MKSKKSEQMFNGTNAASTCKRFRGLMFSPALLLIALLLAVLSPACGLFGGGDDDAKPCNGKECKNGGTFTENTCDCECLPGFIGATCETELTPQSIKVKEIIVTKFPATANNGSTWDTENGHKEPDIFVRIFDYQDPQNPVIKVETKVEQDADYKKHYKFSGSGINLNIGLDNPSQKHAIVLFHKKEIPIPIGPPVFTYIQMANNINFFPYKKDNGFPDTLTLENSNVAFKVVVDYIH